MGAEVLSGVGRVVVLRAAAIGDYVMALPALRALRAAYPEAQLVLVGSPWQRQFLAGRPGPVDRLLVLPPVPDMVGSFDHGAGPNRLDDLLTEIRAEHFDLAVQMHGGGAQSNPLVRSFGARLTVGLRAEGAPPLDRWLHYDPYQPEIFRCLELVGLVGATVTEVEPVLDLLPSDTAEAVEVLGVPDRPVVALHPGAIDPRRRWPVERFAAVGDALAAAGADVVVTGGMSERDLVGRLVQSMRWPARSVVGRLSLGGLVGLYARCAVVVGTDTGPLHLARAVGTRTATVYWCGNMITAAPLTRSLHRPIISWTVHCPVCGVSSASPDVYPKRWNRPCEHTDPFVTDVPVGEVRDAALELLESSKDAPQVPEAAAPRPSADLSR